MHVRRIVSSITDQNMTFTEDGDNIQVPFWTNVRDFDDKVILHPHHYFKLFNKSFNGRQSKRGIVKILHGKRKIYRMFYAHSIDQNMIGLTQLSLQELNCKPNCDEIEICGGIQLLLKLNFFWNNPFHEIRIAFKLALLSIILAIIALFK